MNHQLMKGLVRRLVEVEPKESPVVSCFVNLDLPRQDYFFEIESQARLMGRRFRGAARLDYDQSIERIHSYLQGELKPKSRSVVLYARGGEHPFFLPVQFEAPLETEFIVDSVPNIYPLIELKDTYHRFVVVIMTDERAQILETTIGSITEEILAERPELRERVGREWTREHYQNHKREREDQFIREKIEIIDSLMSRRGHNHLYLTGTANMVGRFKSLLPERLRKAVLSTTQPNAQGRGVGAVLVDALEAFARAEQEESHDCVRRLEGAVLGKGLGIAGYDACLGALSGGYADLLIMDQDLDWSQRENLVRHATLAQVDVETVSTNEVLTSLGGVGCLLRYDPKIGQMALTFAEGQKAA
ncbi:MAG: hypothetical protein AAGJ31_02365 [Verrucomicrobiota bacterium]